ncbi:hypothetical protein SDC9_132665 [bioreactor metagenome]|uniref:Uncharacterized protein n=1 Tax=bioreactor metagenome TaxID=1076179 RepID=A0A645D8B2_9ZZZZ
MADKENGFAHALEAFDVGKQIFDLLRGKHGGRFVKDDKVRFADHDFQYFNALLFAYGQRTNDLLKVERNRVVGAGFLQHVYRRVFIDASVFTDRFNAQYRVLPDLEHGDEHKVLVHDADSQPGGVLRVFEADLCSVVSDRSLIRRERAAEDVHQRGLSRAVFSDDGVNRALFNG